MRVEVAHFLCMCTFFVLSSFHDRKPKIDHQAELRSAEVNELLAIEERSEEQNTELETLTDSVQSLEPELRASIAAEGEDVVETTVETPEGRELRSLIDKASIGGIVSHALRNKATSGADRELQDHYGCSGNEIPLELLRAPVEARAITAAPSDTGAQQSEIVQPVFADGDAAFLGARETMLQAGDAVFPVLSTRPTVHGPFTGSDSAADTTGTFTADTLEPNRIQAAFSYRRTDAVRFAGMDQSLRSALSSGLREGLDAQLISQIVTDVSRTTASAADTFASYRSRFVYALIDGRYANTEADIRLLMGNSTLQDAAVLYRANSADDSAVDSLRRITGGLRISPNIAAVASHKQDVVVRRGLRDDIHIGLWPGVEIIDDQVTKAATGEVVLTAVLMAAWKVARAAGFARIESQHQ